MFRDYDKYFIEPKNPWSYDGIIALNEISQVYKIENKKVLDLGFGEGRHIKEFLKLNCQVTGIEISKVGSEKISKFLKRKKDEKTTILNQDFFKFQFKKKQDIIFSYMSLQYSKNKKEFETIIKNIQNSTKKNGINYLKLPTKNMTLEFPVKIQNINQIKKLYIGWNILFEKQETIQKTKNKTGSYITIIFQKK